MKYERLTDPFVTNEVLLQMEEEDLRTDDKRYIRLSELEDKIENGTLVELPCKVGDTVFVLFDPYFIADIFIMEVEKIFIRDGKIVVCGEHKDTREYYSVVSDYIFLTKDEAEKRLAELRGENKER